MLWKCIITKSFATKKFKLKNKISKFNCIEYLQLKKYEFSQFGFEN